MRTLLKLDASQAPPQWALLELALLRAQAQACKAFFAKYFDERGYLRCLPRWGGNDGPDDAIENLVGWPLLYLMGAPDFIKDACHLGWEGHLRQYTEAKTIDVPFTRDGMYYREFPVMFDWVHNGEGLTTFNLHGLFAPRQAEFEARVRRFAGFYDGTDPQAPNYDTQHKIIRSLINGSRGPMLRKATALDWAGDPLEEVQERFIPLHGERNFEEMLAHFEDYTDVAGDHPSNMVATTLGLNAYTLTGEAHYRDWLLQYVDAWCERTAANNGIIPSNIGLDGTIGGAADGKWYGGCYGWGFTVVVPQNGSLSSRNTVPLGVVGFGNATLLSGDTKYAKVWGNMLDQINSNAQEINGQTQYPSMYGDEGWYQFTQHPYNRGALEVYYWSMDPADQARLDTTSGWIGFLEGNAPDYPVQALSQDFETVRRKMEMVHQDPTTPDTRLSDNPNPFNPATPDNLVALMMGGIHTHHGGPLHCRVRYFDPLRQRAGMPEDVAALVDGLSATGMSLNLVNTNQTSARDIIIQGGAYAEHQFDTITYNGQEITVNDSAFRLTLDPGCGGHLEISMQRYAHQPTFDFPWDR